MNQPTFFLLLGLCAAGFSSGYAAKRLTGSAPPADSATIAESGEIAAASPSMAPARGGGPVAPAAPGPPSTDTLETLLAADDRSVYGRLALWMMDASEQEISAYWQAYRQKDNRRNDINDIIFINWTRLDPHAALAAAAGTSDEHYAWWAWACHDPKAALAHAVANHPGHIGHVTWGIGEFHGDWVRANWDLIPDEGRDRVIGGMTKWDDAADPLAILEFLKKTGSGFNQRMFQSLVRKDPWAAYDWLQENGGIVAANYGSTDNAMAAVLKSFAESDPGSLVRLAQQTPSGEMKRKIEAAVFENLLKTDPEAALRQAKEEKAPRIAAERLATVGLSLVKTDPDKAFEIARDLFATTPDALTRMTYVYRPDGTSGSGGAVAGVNELMDALMAKDPARLMETQNAPQEIHPMGRSSFVQLAGKWAEQDLPAYTGWVNEKADPAVREQAASVVIDRLRNQQHFEEAAEWAMSMEIPDNYLQNVFHGWGRSNPDEAREWLEATDLPDSQRDRLARILENN